MEYFKGERSVHEAAAENVESITHADGVAWLKAVLEVKPGYRGVVPLWTQLSLQALSEGPDGFKALDVAKAVGLPGVSSDDQLYAVFARWRDQMVFDPVTGEVLAV